MRYPTTLVMIFFSSTLFAGEHFLLKDTFSNGGNRASSTNYILQDAIGQSVIGEAKNTNYLEQVGFYNWFEKLITGVAESKPEPFSPIPKVYSLSQSIPNPFHAECTIKFGLPVASRVSLKIYNTLGQVVKSLVQEHKNPGIYTITWDGRNETGKEVAAGVYFYKIKANNFSKTRRLILLR